MNRILNMDIGCRLSIAFYGLWMPLVSYKAYTLAGMMLIGEITSIVPLAAMAAAAVLILFDCVANARDAPGPVIGWLRRVRWALYGVVGFGLTTALFAGSRYQVADINNGFMYISGAAICMWAIGCEFRSRQEGPREATN